MDRRVSLHPDASRRSPEPSEWEVAESWTKFLYPFLFDTDAPWPAVPVLDNPEGRGVPWVESAFGPQELENMLPYVKQYLQLPTNHRRYEVAADCLSQEAIFRISSDPALRFRFTDMTLHLFFNGVGCVALEIRPVGDSTIQTVEAVNACLASLANGAHFAVDRAPRDMSPAFSVAGFCQARGSTTVKSLLEALLFPFRTGGAALSLTPMVDRFLPVYGAVLLRSTHQTPIDLLDERFYEFAQHHLTILRKTFTPNDISSFSEIHLEDASHHYMPYHNVIHSQSLDGGFVLAYDNGLPHFARDPAPAMESFRTSYFSMMLIPFHQRLSILRYATHAANLGLSRDGPALRRLREDIYDFTSRCYFSQASVSEERNHIYARWQEEFHVVRMYNDLKEEVHDIDNYLADLQRHRDTELRSRALQQDSRNNQLFSLITMVFLPVSVLLYAIPAIPVLGQWINFASHPWRSIAILIGMAAFVTFILAAMFRMLRRARWAPPQ
jgi:hypothetical protein